MESNHIPKSVYKLKCHFRLFRPVLCDWIFSVIHGNFYILMAWMPIDVRLLPIETLLPLESADALNSNRDYNTIKCHENRFATNTLAYSKALSGDKFNLKVRKNLYKINIFVYICTISILFIYICQPYTANLIRVMYAGCLFISANA